MAKNITIVVLIFLLCIAILYGFFQTTAAKRMRIQAQENMKMAIEYRALADKNAAYAQAEAERCNECCLRSQRSK